MAVEEEGLGGGFRFQFSIDHRVPILFRENLGVDARGLHLLLDNPGTVLDSLALGGYAGLA